MYYSQQLMQRIEKYATHRDTALFSKEFNECQKALKAVINKSRIVIIGAAGSIGSAVAKLIVKFEPKALCLIDINENSLVELVRDLRADKDKIPEQFLALPLALGSKETELFFQTIKPFDYVINLSAMKHVRSEKNIYSMYHMLRTNVLSIDNLLKVLPGTIKKFFSVSSDKAVNPASFMGATKLLMEKTMCVWSQNINISSARFANVAFSNGSLLEGFLRRIDKKQPIGAPTDIRRYFISHQEAAQLCLLSIFFANNNEIFVPKLKALENETTFTEIATLLLKDLGYEPFLCSSDEEAIGRFQELFSQKKWPCIFSPSNTSGEKNYEEFFSTDEDVCKNRYDSVYIVKQKYNEEEVLKIKKLLSLLSKPMSSSYSKADVIQMFSEALPGFQHVETNKSLDEKI